MALTRWEPSGVRSLRDQFNRMFEDVMTPALRTGLGLTSPSVDVYEQDKQVVVEAELPGLDIDDVTITATENSLTLKGETSRETEVQEESFYRSERRYGAFLRTIDLPSAIDPEQARASFKNGVLTITAPLSASAKGHRIPIQGEGTARATSAERPQEQGVQKLDQSSDQA